MDFEEKLFFV